MTTNPVSCCNGWPPYTYGPYGVGPKVEYPVTAASVLNPYGSVQVQAFEPAFYTPKQVYAVVPYAPSVVAAVTPVFPAAAAATSAVAAAATGAAVAAADLAADTLAVADVAPAVSSYPAPPFRANPCGCCSRAYSPLPPNGFEAWRGAIYDVNRPYDALIGPACAGGGAGSGCGGGCRQRYAPPYYPVPYEYPYGSF